MKAALSSWRTGMKRMLSLLLERLVDVERLLPRDAVDVLDALVLEAAHEQFGGRLLARSGGARLGKDRLHWFDHGSRYVTGCRWGQTVG